MSKPFQASNFSLYFLLSVPLRLRIEKEEPEQKTKNETSGKVLPTLRLQDAF